MSGFNSDTAGNVVTRQMLASGSKANTAAATSGNGYWIDTLDLEGFIAVTQIIEGVTAGTIVGKLQVADDANGTNAADVSGAAFASVASGGSYPVIQTLSVARTLLAKRYLGYVGTITTGPAAVGNVIAQGIKKIG